jgi:hypothetical protein
MKINYLLFFVLFIISHSVYSQSLLFKSSFEEGVSINDPYYDSIDSGTWWQDIVGSDNPEFSWPIRLWGETGRFQVLVDAKLPSNEYIQNTIEVVNNSLGIPTRALHQNILKKAEGWTQNPYIVETKKEGGDIYIKYLLKYDKNLVELLGSDGWLTFFEWKTKGDYRIAAYIYEGLDKNLYWYVHGDNEANGGLEYEEFWYEEDHIHPVPVGEWFSVEFFWHRSTGDDGRFWWAVNGEVIADHKGPNKLSEPINRLMLFNTYSNSNNLEQWVDDIEIWDGFPCGEGIPCYTTPSLPKGFALPNKEWRQISLPATPPSNNNTVLNLFADELGNNYGNEWILYSYDPQSNSYVNPGPNGILKQGVGYWIIQVTGETISLNLPNTSTATPVVLSTECASNNGCYEIKLATTSDDIQWNMLGYPFQNGSNLTRVRVVTNGGVCANGCSLDEAKNANIFHNRLWGYDGNQLNKLSDFTSWGGFWAVTLQEANNLAPKLLIPID